MDARERPAGREPVIGVNAAVQPEPAFRDGLMCCESFHAATGEGFVAARKRKHSPHSILPFAIVR